MGFVISGFALAGLVAGRPLRRTQSASSVGCQRECGTGICAGRQLLRCGGVSLGWGSCWPAQLPWGAGVPISLPCRPFPFPHVDVKTVGRHKEYLIK